MLMTSSRVAAFTTVPFFDILSFSEDRVILNFFMPQTSGTNVRPLVGRTLVAPVKGTISSEANGRPFIGFYNPVTLLPSLPKTTTRLIQLFRPGNRITVLSFASIDTSRDRGYSRTHTDLPGRRRFYPVTEINSTVLTPRSYNLSTPSPPQLI
jgi:hypothetical protein